MKKKKKNVCFFLLASFLLSGYDLAAQEVNYRDDAVFLEKVKEEIKAYLASGEEIIGVNALKRKVVTLEEYTKVEASLLPRRKKNLTPEKLYEECKPSSLLIMKYHTSEGKIEPEILLWASATVLTEDGICLTNFHVLADILADGKDGKFDPENRDTLRIAASSEGRVYPITEILSYDFPNDLAVFRVDTRGDKLKPVPLGEPAPVGTSVHLIAHPDGRLFNYGTGVVTRNTSRDFYGTDTPKMEISVDFAKGSSGGAILDDAGNLLGIVSFSNSIYFDTEGKSLQMFIRSTIPVGVIKPFFLKE